ncbi:TonB-linked SusC/RagA family outer membrane protein [Lewinella aquimaris]|uniref:TonB-linked SusC/RagA family outer membrane protein n=1 Tax=Neolewinella aquimaris TaxID=1835722 RepID=A0A840E3Q5_9BACT|nr:TonB-dependent receptor [Neolewinella aquimaris]MBB4078372.1 TonB-linked SusC/RagA family outer membrane protein [Neolewinella aquimaris]
MKSFKLIVWVLLLGSFSALQAQQAITGTVVDESGVGLIGATILVDNTTTGTVTDIDGNFELETPAGATGLTVSYTGFTTQRVRLTVGQTVYDIVLAEDGIGLDEVVVVGYSPVRRKDLTGAVSSISTKDVNAEAGATVQGALRQAAGVVVQQSNGAPGAGYNIRVRGVTSINASNEPLFVVDGVPVISGDFSQQGVGGQGTNALADINPADIESMEVLKDASTTAIYGSRAANGVVLITTKSGKSGKTKINFNSSYGFNELPNTIDVVDGATYNDYLGELFGRTANFFGMDSTVSSNWQDLIFASNPLTSQQLSISGGDVKTKFYGSLGYDDNQGALNGTRFKRYSGRLNLDHTASDKLALNMNLGYTNSDNKRIQGDNNIYGAVSAAILLPPTVPVRNEDGTYGSAFGLENPVAATEVYDNHAQTNRIIGNASATFFPIDAIALKAKLGVDNVNYRENVFEPSSLQSTSQGQIVESSNVRTRIISEYTATYNGSVGAFKLNSTVGAIFQRDDVRRNYFETNDLPSDNFPSADAAASPATVSGDKFGSTLQSYIGTVNVNNGGLYVTASFRADGSSRFVNNRWGYFPGIAAGYDLASSEKVGPFEQLKLRASYGQTGNNNIGDFQTRPLFAGGASYLTTPGISQSQLGNPDLVWETTTQFNAGLDIALLTNRIGASFDFYVKNTDDLILNRPIPTTSGFGTVVSNVGSMRNTGVEASLTFVNVQQPDFTWNTTLTGAFNKNEVTALFDDQPQDFGFATRLAVGQPVGSFFGLVTDGIYQNQAEIDADNALNDDRDYIVGAGPGDFRFVDQNDDGIINDDDRTFIGQALPDFTGGVNNKLAYKGLELDFFFQFSFGNDVYNNNLGFAEGLNSVFAPTVRSYEGAWRMEGDGDDFPRIVGGAPSDNNRQDSDRYVEDGSFVRLKTATLAYNLPRSVLDPAGIDRLRIFVSGTNLVTWTDYSWFDPEVNAFGDSNVALGTDFLTLPISRTVEFGINLGF